MRTARLMVGVCRCFGKLAGFRSFLSVTAVSTAAAAVAAQAQDCVGLKGQTLGWNEATITDATVVADSDKQSEHCRVLVKMNDSMLRFESRLPTSGWNSK